MHPVSRRQFLTASAALATGAVVGTRVARACLPPPDPTTDPRMLVAGNTRFGLDLYGQLRTDTGNLFLSPLSISAALAMTTAGAKGKTLDEMTEVLHLPENPHPRFGNLLASLNDQEMPLPTRQPNVPRGYDFSIANAIWAQQGFPWREEFKQLVARHYSAGTNDVDYTTNPEAARVTINNWVQKQTREKIKDLIPAGLITRLTRMVLTNAIYFKGQWAARFEKSATKQQPFLLADGGKVEVPLMHRVGSYSYAETEGYQLVELPYAGSRIGMVVVLPRKPDGLPQVEKELTAARLADDLARLAPERAVHLSLPRFKAEKAFSLKKPLMALGMKAPFVAADFSGMNRGNESLSISEVIHKALVEVDEEGTTAAAGTAVIVAKADAAPPTPKHIRADHPFLFLLRDTHTGSVLFLGRVTNPV